jgi:ElaB/YqjD/DUF883 family membrane-anchored ribosome-binding protein
MAEKTTHESGDTTEAREPEQIEQEIEQTREELGDTVAAVTEKADAKKQVKGKVSGAKKKAAEKKDAATQKATATKGHATAKAEEVTPESARAGMQQAQQLARENPVPVIVGIAAFGGFILGWVMGRR